MGAAGAVWAEALLGGRSRLILPAPPWSAASEARLTPRTEGVGRPPVLPEAHTGLGAVGEP